MKIRESRPGQEAAIPRTHSGLTVPDTPDNRDDDTPTIAEMNPRGQRIALAYMEAGIVIGIEMGRERERAEMAALWQQAHDTVQSIARQPDFAELCERRAEPHRAARQRALLAERGVIV